MKLWLLRHGQAQPYAASDAQRALTEQGCAEVTHSAQQLQGLQIDTLLVSPYVRAQQTAQLLVTALNWPGVVQTVPWLTPETPVRQTLMALGGYAGNLLVVAHQPLLGDLAGLLIHGHRQSPLPMATAQLRGLEGQDLIAGLMQLL